MNIEALCVCDTKFTYPFELLFCFCLFFETGVVYVIVPLSWTCFADQAELQLKEICLPLPPKC